MRIERGAALPPRSHVDPLPALVFPLESSVVVLHVGGASHRIDRSTFGLVPAKTRVRVEPLSVVTHLLTIFVADDARARVRREYAPHVDPARFEAVLSTPRVFPRTRWVDELAHRTLFELDVCEKHGSPAARFLLTELTKELYFLGNEQLQEKTRASVVHEGSELVKRARKVIEDDLFAALRVDELARRCATSESTLLRAFRREVGCAPATYVRDRRLDESLLMLESGKWSVGEVATRVGYGNVPAFSVAFRRRFGVAPSAAREKKPKNPVLPPHGQAPRRKRRSV